MIKIMFLPPATTSLIQPMDQGLITASKCIYKKKFLHMILLVDSSSSDLLMKIIAEYKLKDCILNVSESWKQISKLTLTDA